MDDHTKAYALAKSAAEINFAAALSGLMAGHAAAMKAVEDRVVEKDIAFLMALALCEKGARLDKGGAMLDHIAKGLRGRSLSPIEQRVLERADATI